MPRHLAQKLDGTILDMELTLDATVHELRAAVANRLELPIMFVALALHGVACLESQTLVEASAGIYQVLIWVTPALSILHHDDVDEKIQALLGLAKVGHLAGASAINLIVKHFFAREATVRHLAKEAMIGIGGKCTSLCIDLRITLDNGNSERIKVLPNIVGHLASLSSLNLDLEVLQRDSANHELFQTRVLEHLGTCFPTDLANLTSLGFIWHGVIDGQGAKHLGKGLGNLTKLECLQLELNTKRNGSPLGDENAQYLGEGIGMLRNLTALQLNLSMCLRNSDTTCFQYFCNGISQLTRLTSLNVNLHSVGLDHEGTRCFSECLQNLVHLTSMELDFAQDRDSPMDGIGNEGAQHLGECIGKLEQLKSLQLHLHENQIGDTGAAHLCQALRRLTQLASLSVYLFNNEMGDEAKQLVSACRTLVRARKRSLSGN